MERHLSNQSLVPTQNPTQKLKIHLRIMKSESPKIRKLIAIIIKTIKNIKNEARRVFKKNSNILILLFILFI